MINSGLAKKEEILEPLKPQKKIVVIIYFSKVTSLIALNWIKICLLNIHFMAMLRKSCMPMEIKLTVVMRLPFNFMIISALCKFEELF